MKISLTRQLMLSTGIIYLLGTIVFGWFIGYTQAQKMFNNKVEETSGYIKAISVSIENHLYRNNISAVENVLSEYMHLGGFEKISIVNKNNVILTEFVSENNEVLNTFRYGKIYSETDIGNENYKKNITTQLEHSATNIGRLHALVNFSQIKELKHNIWLTIFISGFCIYILVLIVSMYKLKSILQPLDKTAEFTKEFILNLGKRVDTQSNVIEINDMVQAINWSSIKLKEQEEELREQSEQLEQQVLKRTKELNIAKKKAESASEEKSRFLSHMSHELRTPLNSILGFSQILMMKPGDMSALQLSNVKEINNSGSHLLSLVNEILDISKIEEGELQIDITRVDVALFFNNFYRSVEKMAIADGLSIKLDIQLSDTVYIDADEKRLTQIMYNLVSNAIKYTHKTGEIKLTLTLEQDKLKVEVSDTGIGIEDANFDKVFDKFTRFNNEHHAEGAGIGLHLTKELVELMHGSIDFSSEYNKGSVFWFLLPVSK